MTGASAGTSTAASAAWQVGERVTGGMITLATGVALARMLGPTQYGTLTYALAFVALAGPVAGLGIDALVMRDVVARPAARASVLPAALMLKGLGGAAAWLLVATAAGLMIGDPLQRLVILIVALGLPLQFGEVFEWYFAATGRPRHYVPSKILTAAGGAAARIGVALLGGPLALLAAIVPLESTARGLALAAAYSRSGGPTLFQAPARAEAWSLLRQSWTLALAGVAAMLYLRIDQVLIGSMLSVERAGQYASALLLSEAWYLLPMMICRAATPWIIEGRAVSPVEQLARLHKLLRGLVAANLVVAVVVTAIAAPLMRTIFGASYESAAAALSIHIWTGVFVSLGVGSSLWLVNENLQRHALARTLVGGIANVGLNLLLIPRWGIAGSASATLVSQVIAAWLMDLADPRTRVMFRVKLRALLLSPPAPPSR